LRLGGTEFDAQVVNLGSLFFKDFGQSIGLLGDRFIIGTGQRETDAATGVAQTE